MSLSVVHLSKTPLAGAPASLVRALRAHTDLDVHLIDLERWGLYEHDIVFSENPDYAIALIRNADVLHLHNYIHLDSQDFSPVNLREFVAKKGLVVRHFHSQPGVISRFTGETVNEIVSSEIPQLVMAQHAERFYPKARVVPNIIPQDSEEYVPLRGTPRIDVFFGPTSHLSAWRVRWDTKGMPETLSILESLRRAHGFSYRCVHKEPFSEAIKAKKMARVVVDELVTGGYHLSGVEGLSLGKPVFSYLDDRTQFILRAVSGATECPFISVRLEESKNVLERLLGDFQLCEEVGRFSRAWIEKFWSDRELVDHYVYVYRSLIEGNGGWLRQEDLSIDSKRRKFFYIDAHDIAHELRREHNLDMMKLSSRIKKGFIKKINKVLGS